MESRRPPLTSTQRIRPPTSPPRGSNARSVPGASSRCCGTDKLAACPGLMRITWLPRWRSLTHPAFWKIRTARSPETEGKAAIYAGTSTSRTSIVRGMPRAARVSRHPAMASRMLSSASASVRPCEMQPGMEGHSATSMPVSSGSSVTSSFILEFYCTLLPTRRWALAAAARLVSGLRCDCAVTSEACSGISVRRRIPTGLKHDHLDPTGLNRTGSPRVRFPLALP